MVDKQLQKEFDELKKKFLKETEEFTEEYNQLSIDLGLLELMRRIAQNRQYQIIREIENRKLPNY